jgi:hypothetical protein
MSLRLQIGRQVFGKRIFGKREAPSPRRYGDTGLDEIVELDMNEVASYADAMAKHRGYPDEASAMIARRVVFLERRGLPGLAHLHREVLLFQNEPLSSRFQLRRPDGREGGHCPFYAGIDLEPSFDRLTSCTPEDRLWAAAPSHSLLLVPKLAEWLRPTGRRAVFWWANGSEVPGLIIVEGYRLEYLSKDRNWRAIDQLRDAQHIGFSNCPDDFDPTPSPRSGFRDKISVQLRHISMMQEFLSVPL